MLVIVATNHLPIFRPVNERNGSAVQANESLAIIMDERNEVGFLLGVHFKIAPSVEKHSIEIVQVLCVEFQFLLGESFRVGAKGGVPEASLFSQTLNRCHGVRDRFVAVSFFFANDQEMFLQSSRLRPAQIAK